MTTQRVVQVDAADVPAELMIGLTNAILRAVRTAARAYIAETEGWSGDVRLISGRDVEEAS